MLNENEIVNCVNNSVIKVKSCFDLETKEYLGSEYRDLSTEGERSCFKLKGARLSVRLGPIIKKHSGRKVSKKNRFKNHDDIHDLRTSSDVYVLAPNETVSILSCEEITLNDEVASLILPRLTLADVGIDLIPTYIDPHWNGILQMVITNRSSHYHTLRFGESIGQCFFFKAEGGVPNDYKEKLIEGSHHYAQTYNKIMDQDAEPFPNKKRHEDLGGIRSLLNYLASNRKKVISVFAAIGLIPIVAAVFKAGYIYNDFSKISQNENKIIKLEDSNKQRTKVSYGSADVKIKSGESHKINLKLPGRVHSEGIFCFPESKITCNASVVKLESDYSEMEVEFKPLTSYIGTLKWFVYYE